PTRWKEWPGGESAAWKTSDGGHTFVCTGQQSGEAWLRYRHLVPSYDDWQEIEVNHRLPSGVTDRPGRLISDFYAYNTAVDTSSRVSGWFPLLRSYWPPTDIEQRSGPGDPPLSGSLGQHWVDDLAIECIADATGKQGQIGLMLLRGGVKHICRI